MVEIAVTDTGCGIPNEALSKIFERFYRGDEVFPDAVQGSGIGLAFTKAILRAEAEKEKMIKEAEGQAAAILKVQQANADGIRAIKEAGADDAVLTLKSLEALGVLANGKATKIVVPSDLQGLASLATTFKGIVEEQKVPAGKEVQK